ncbi:MAG: hypothetical protein MUC31_04705, partial [Bacteroidales bacterium]|nr:hypothetical protein [Bacteroidales bacterium]
MINSGSTVYFKSGAKIIVHPNAKLIIDGGTMTRACDGYWQGIELWGDKSKNQFPYPDGHYDQGYVRLTNNATIEYAIEGIITAKRIFPLDTDPDATGGIIIAEDALFRNNLFAIEIYPYTNTHPGTAEEFPNLCSFSDCQFTLDQDHPYVIHKYDHQILLQGVDGIPFYNCRMEIQNTVTDWKHIPEKFVSLDDCENIMIKSCDFTNEFSRLESPTNSRGTALYAFHSGVDVEPRCLEYDPSGGCNEWDPSYFSGFTYGIYAMSLPMIPLMINRAIFEDNARGLYMSGGQPAEIVLNHFLMDDGLAPTVDTIYGLYMDHCEGYHVEGNLFEGNLALDEIVAGAVIVDSDQGDNEIYNNVFRHLDVGLEPQGTNRTPDGGLCLKCNEFEDNFSDIYIFANGTSEGIAQDQ